MCRKMYDRHREGLLIMYQIDFNKPEHVHFIGIGGISMSGLAEILLDEGFSISGSDSHETALTEHLETKGARVYYGQRAANIEREPGISVVVYTAAIHEDNPEFRAARDQGLPMLSRAELLGELMRNYKEAIAISGTHGKTTTTSMLTDILLAGDLDPTISVGGILKDIGGNIRVGGPDLFVTEACEYTNSFLSFYPTMEVILNVEEDHLDFFKDIEDIRHSFRLFENIPSSPKPNRKFQLIPFTPPCTKARPRRTPFQHLPGQFRDICVRILLDQRFQGILKAFRIPGLHI